MKHKKNQIRMMYLVFIGLILSGCALLEKEPIATEKGEMLRYSLNNKQTPDNYYIQKGNQVSPILSEGLDTTNFENPIVWFTKYDHLIPTIEEGDKLLIKMTNVPTEFKLRPMTDIGWTVGVPFKLHNAIYSNGEDNNITEEENNDQVSFGNPFSPHSEIKRHFEYKFDRTDYKKAMIESVNGQKLVSGMLNKDGFLLGLTQGAMYKFNYYVGTIFSSIDIKADTHVYVSNIEESQFTITNINRLKNDYFELELPQNLANGYYLINDKGIFYYNRNKNVDYEVNTTQDGES